MDFNTTSEILSAPINLLLVYLSIGLGFLALFISSIIIYLIFKRSSGLNN